MDKNIIKLSYISIIGFILILILRFILAHKILHFYDFNMRRFYGLLGTIVYFPLVGITALVTAFVFYYYIKNKFKAPLVYFFITLPAITYILIFILALLNISNKLYF